MSALSPAWYLKIVSSGLSYITAPDGCEINYKANNYNSSKLLFPDTALEYTNVFSTESEVQVYIGNPASSGVKMLHGFIDDIDDSMNKREKSLSVSITDWGAYLAGKRNFETKFVKSKTPSQVMTQTLSSVTDGVDTLTGTNVNSVSGTVKQEFEGTQVKDAWHLMAEVGNADYFVDETLDLNFFESGSKLLQTGGVTYRIQDTSSVLASRIMIDHMKPYSFGRSKVNSFRQVKAVSGLKDAIPPISNLDKWSVDEFFDDELGKLFSGFFSIGSDSNYDVDLVGNSLNPVEFGSEALDTDSAKPDPTVKLFVASTSQNIDMRMVPHGLGFTYFLAIPVDQWEEISFWIYNNLTRGAGEPSTIKLRLEDITTGGYWERDIKSYITGANKNAWKYFRFQLPSTTSNSESYSGIAWTKSGSPTKIDIMRLVFSSNTGYTANTFIKFARMFFYRRANYNKIYSGNPPTQKIIVDKSIKNLAQLQKLAESEALRTNREFIKATCTIAGNTNFKKPAYSCEIDFSTTLGTGRRALNPDYARIDSIRHYLEAGVHYTDLTFNNAFDRP